MSEITFKASITKVNGQAPAQHGLPTASVSLAGGFTDQIVAALYAWADGDVVHVTIWREEEHEQLTFDSVPPAEILEPCSECGALGYDHAEVCTRFGLSVSEAAEAIQAATNIIMES